MISNGMQVMNQSSCQKQENSNEIVKIIDPEKEKTNDEQKLPEESSKMMNFNNDCNTQLTADARMLISTFIYLLPFSSPIDVNMALSIPPDYYEEHINPDQFIAFVKYHKTIQRLDVFAARCFHSEDFMIEAGLRRSHRVQAITWLLVNSTMARTYSWVLTLAISYMDLYLAIEQHCEDYKLLTIAALDVAALRSGLSVVELLTSYSPVVNYSNEEIRRMAVSLCTTLGSYTGIPTPNIFLEFYLGSQIELNPSMLRWARRVCYYIIELGLLEEELAIRPACLRCCAVLFVLRLILKKYCTCSTEVNRENNQCCHRRMQLWPKGMYRLTGVADCRELRDTAVRYASILHVSEQQRTCTVYRHFDSGLFDYIPTDPMLESFTWDDVTDAYSML